MLDDNLPTFLYRPSDNPLATVLYFTHNGSSPAAEMILRRQDPSTADNQYDTALTDAKFPDIVFAEILVRPELAPASVGVSERAGTGKLTKASDRSSSSSPTGRHRSGSPSTSPAPPVVPEVPDTIVLRLYNPDQNIGIRQLPGAWNRHESWEFEMTESTFRPPITSQIDRESAAEWPGGAATPGATGPTAAVVDFRPKVMFRWRRDGRLSRDMTCYMIGKSVAGRKSKEPDITVAMYKGGKNEAVTIYEPNLQRVDVQDRKGLEIVLLLGAAAIRDLYLNPKSDIFKSNSQTGSAPAPAPNLSLAPAPSKLPPVAPSDKPVSGLADTETSRLRQVAAAEQELEARKREERDRVEQHRIVKMLEKEEKERRRRDVEVERETQRLREMYGADGQGLFSIPSSPRSGGGGPPPALPPRPWYTRPLSSLVSPSTPRTGGSSGRDRGWGLARGALQPTVESPTVGADDERAKKTKPK